MTKQVPHLVLCLLIGAISVLAPASARGQTDNDAWRVSITPYLWLPSVNTTLAVKDEPIEVQTDTESFDILSKLDFALLLSGEVAKGKFGLLYDFQTLKLSDDGTTTIGEPRDFETGLTFADATLALEYRLIDEPKFSLDGFGGARVIYAKAKIDLDPSAHFPGVSGDQSKTWVDPIVGLKCRYRMGDSWALNGYCDIGGFAGASTITYQLIGTVSYNFNKTVALDVGYRFFFDKFENGNFKLDAKLYGPVLGLTFSF